uniref:Uncharacterized protein n=1 Tax=Romanomermis culicivorax TaxID=13658 RepID=A0A915KZX0_ROMCU
MHQAKPPGYEVYFFLDESRYYGRLIEAAENEVIKHEKYSDVKVPLNEANRRFMACCESSLPKGCHQICRYDVSLNLLKGGAIASTYDILGPQISCPPLPRAKTAKKTFFYDKSNTFDSCNVGVHFTDYILCAKGSSPKNNLTCCHDMGVFDDQTPLDLCKFLCDPFRAMTLSMEQAVCGSSSKLRSAIDSLPDTEKKEGSHLGLRSSVVEPQQTTSKFIENDVGGDVENDLDRFLRQERENILASLIDETMRI